VLTASGMALIENVARGGRGLRPGDYRALGEAMRDAEDGERLRLLRRLLSERGPRGLAEFLTRTLEALGFPDPAEGAARIVAHLTRGTALSRRTDEQEDNDVTDLSRTAARLGHRLAVMPGPARRALIGAWREAEGDEAVDMAASQIQNATPKPADSRSTRGTPYSRSPRRSLEFR
jgi:hypothetical protein